MTRASALLFLAVLTCSKGQRVANVPKDSVQSSAPLPVSLGAPDSLSTDGPLDEIPSLLAGFDSQAEAAREQARAVAATPRADSLFLSFRNRFLKVGEQVTNRFDQATSIQSNVLQDTSTSRQLTRSEEHTSELQSRQYLVCRLLLEKKKTYTMYRT